MRNNNIKISVIMPVYNVESFLNKAVDSILSQSLDEFELFLVDDGSTDSSPKICDEYGAKDKRVKVIHQENSGAHNARNNALKKAIGKYVCFFDSDDYVDSDMLKDLYELAEKYNSDLVISGFYINTYYDENNYKVFDYIPFISDKNSDNNLNNSLDNNLGVDIDNDIESFDNKYDFRISTLSKNFDRNMFYPPWNKLYKLSYLRDNNLFFPITYRDDFPFVLSVIKDIEKVTYYKKEYYNFIRKRSDSETQKYVANLFDKREEEHKMMIELFDYYVDDFDELIKKENIKNNSKSNNKYRFEITDASINKFKNEFKEMLSRRYIDRLVECMVNLFNTECNLSIDEKKQLIKKYLNSDNFNDCIKFARPNKLYLKIMYQVLKSKNIMFCYNMAKFIYEVKKKDVKLFSTLKTNR